MNACDPQNFEPNLALNLEISDMINAKKGNACVVNTQSTWINANYRRPREAAIAIVNYINHRNPNVSLLALNVSLSILEL